MKSILHAPLTNPWEKVVGHDIIANKLKAAARQYRIWLEAGNPRRIGPFLFAGHNVEGKSEAAKALSVDFYGSENSYVKMTMSELLSRGDIPGGGIVLYVTEIEIATTEEIKRLQGIGGDHIVILGSTVGAQYLQSGMESELQDKKVKDEVRKCFGDQVYNGFAEVLSFNLPDIDAIKATLRHFLLGFPEANFKKQFVLYCAPSVIEHAMEMAYMPVTGLQPVCDNIVKELTDAIAILDYPEGCLIEAKAMGHPKKIVAKFKVMGNML